MWRCQIFECPLVSAANPGGSGDFSFESTGFD